MSAIQPAAMWQIHGQRRLSWHQLDTGATALSDRMLRLGLPRQSVVAVVMRNSPEFVMSYVAAFKAGHIPANVNYRYAAEEIGHVLDSCKPAVVLFDDGAAAIEPWAKCHPETAFWSATPGSLPGWASSFDAHEPTGPTPRPHERTGDDIVLLYTGGTTGRPKGVMWRQDDVAVSALTTTDGSPSPSTLDELLARRSPGRGIVVPCPMMHATGLYGALAALLCGGVLVTFPGGRFEPDDVWTAVAEHEASELYIVGDAFGVPLAESLEATTAPHRLGHLQWINSAGAVLSQQTKTRLLRRLPWVRILDYYGSSEANGLGTSVSEAGENTGEHRASAAGTRPGEVTTTFHIGPDAALISGDGTRLIAPGSDEVGIVAASGRLPLGYYGDASATQQLFREIEGRRYLMSGDHGRLASDGTLDLLGRGSSIVNTGGEKVFVEEVDAVLRCHPAVADAVCVGVPDARFGQVVACLVALLPGSEVDSDSLVDFARTYLAGYKLPRLIRFVALVPRTAAGKPDYRRVRQVLLGTN